MSKKHISESAPSYILYEGLLRLTDEAGGEFKVRGLTRGEAINRAVLCNRCNLEWAERHFPNDTALRDSFMKYSFKAKPDPDSASGDWLLEVSANHRRQHLRKSSKSFEDLFQRLGINPRNPAGLPETPVAPEGDPGEAAPQLSDEDKAKNQAIRNLYGLD